MTNQQDRSVSDWWRTEIIEMEPGVIRYRGYPIEELIGNLSFTQMIWLLLRGEIPSAAIAKLLDAALMSAVDHGPQAPSIAIARMAVTCGVGLNNAMASALNVLGDVHGGAGEQAMEVYHRIHAQLDAGVPVEEAAQRTVTPLLDDGLFVPGFGHRFHPLDPRAPRLLEQVDQAASAGLVTGAYAHIGRAVEAVITARKGKLIPMNIDGATAVVYAELGFSPGLARGLFCLSRAVGILAHAWEQQEQGGRNKGPLPKNYLWTYCGKEQRNFSKEE